MYEFRGAGAQPCQPCCLWSQKRCRWDSQCSITNIKLVCSIKLESYLSYCEGVCQSALKIMHCKLEFTELMKCLQGGYDEPLKERALSDNLSNFEKKMLQICSFFLMLQMCPFLAFEGERTLVPLFCSRAFPCCQGLRCCGQVHSLSQYEVVSCFIVELGGGTDLGLQLLVLRFLQAPAILCPPCQRLP